MKKFIIPLFIVITVVLIGSITVYASSLLDAKTQHISHKINFPAGFIELTDRIDISSMDKTAFDDFIGVVRVKTDVSAILDININADNYSRFLLQLICTSGNANDLETHKQAQIELLPGEYFFDEKLICFSSGIENHETDIIFSLLEANK